MPVDYKKLWILLIEKNISKPQLRKAANISPSTFTKLNKNEFVAMDVLVRICMVLDCDIGDVVEITARNKMRASEVIEYHLNYGGVYADTSKLLRDAAVNRHNRDAFNSFAAKLDIKETNGRYIASSVSKFYVAEFIRNLKISYVNRKFDTEGLSAYIENSEVFQEWDVVIATGDSTNLPFSVGHMQLKPAIRSFHVKNNMVKQWDKDNSVYNELFYKELIGKKILFEHIGNIVSNQVWYQENRAYRPQLIAYTFAKLVFVAQKVNKQINYRLIWDLQEVPSCIDEDIAAISKIAFDVMYDENRPTANIESYCKREECWTNVAKQNYTLSEDGYGVLITPAEKQEESVRAKKDQRIASGIEDELGIFRKGSEYWKSLAEKGKSQNVLSSKDLSIIDNAVKYCEFVYTSLYPKQVKEINIVLNKLKENGIE